MNNLIQGAKIAVVIPSFKVTRHILNVIDRIGPESWRIYVVDDCCPDGSGRMVQEQCQDPRVRVIFNEKNLGVGGAVMEGYKLAISDGADVMVKLDGDGQMDPEHIPRFVIPILAGECDYTKGNRFYDLRHIKRMPRARLIGNAVLSFMAKLSGGYWDIFDPTNGYTAIHAEVAKFLPLSQISRRYFFETDMLFRLNLLRAVIVDIPMDAEYGEEASNLKISHIIGEFLIRHTINFFKRVFYNYYLRDFSVASLEFPLGIAMVAFGGIFGVYKWITAFQAGISTPAGTVMLATLPIILGTQFILAFISHDIRSVPRRVTHIMLRHNKSLVSNDA